MNETLSQLMQAATRNERLHTDFNKRFDKLDSRMDEGFDNILSKMDSFIGLHKGLVLEQAAIKKTVKRHEERISALEAKRLPADHFYD